MASSLKNNLFALAVLFLIAFFSYCRESNKKEKNAVEVKTDCAKPVPLNPNGDSELAVLMRKMMKTSVNLRDKIKNGELPDKFPEEFLKIHSANPTDSETKKASFDGFATNYLASMKTLFNSSKQNVIKDYNSAINSCVSCHTEHCPGPLKAINKLKINEEDGLREIK